MKFVFAEFGDVGEKFVGIVVHRLAGHDPAHVSPESPFAGRVRVAFLVGVLMMLAVRGDPGDRAAFQRQGTADGEEVLHPVGCLVAAMGEETMVAHTYSKASSNPPQKNGDEEGFPTKHEKRGDGAEMDRDHDDEALARRQAG